jgi:heme iron utilization protein
MKSLPEEIRIVIREQELAVLSTRDGDQPYSSLVCFSADSDLTNLFFVTPRNTKKYDNLRKERRVSLLIDNRLNNPGDINHATAITVLGQATEAEGSERTAHLERFLDKLPHLTSFALDASTALFRVRVEKYIAVTRLRGEPEIVIPELPAMPEPGAFEEEE